MVPYTYDWYRGMLKRCLDAGLSFRDFEERPASGVYLRHDVDYSPESALRMARIESYVGASATYFFLVTGTFYNALGSETIRTMRTIAELGHTIGLHFDPATYFDSKPTSADLQRRVSADRSILQSRVSPFTDVVAFHNPPSWALNETLDGISHTYEPAVFENVTYRADSLGRWRNEEPFPDGIDGRTQILTHPALWGESYEPPVTRIRQAQHELVDRTNTTLRTESRVDWSEGSLSW